MEVQNPAQHGRFGDTEVGHLTPGECVLPKIFLERPVVRKLIEGFFMAEGLEMNRYIVGHESNSKNPTTGWPEFFLNFGGLVSGINSGMNPVLNTERTAQMRSFVEAREAEAKKKEEDELVLAQENAQAEERRKRGRASTLLTSSTGLLDQPATASRFLLGS